MCSNISDSDQIWKPDKEKNTWNFTGKDKKKKKKIKKKKEKQTFFNIKKRSLQNNFIWILTFSVGHDAQKVS